MRHLTRSLSSQFRLRHVIFLLLLLVSRFGSAVEPEEGARTLNAIIGGQVASEARPWIVALIANSAASDMTARHFCGGMLIAPTWVLTAAHCVENRSVDTYKVAIGHVNLNAANLPLAEVAEVVVHPFWSKKAQTHDIALIRLVSASGNQPVVLATASMTTAAEDTNMLVLGWGASLWNETADCTLHFLEVMTDTSDFECKSFVYIPGSKPADLMKTEVRLQPFSQCDQRYKALLDSWDVQYEERAYFTEQYTPGVLCIWDADDSSTICYGDSGGPLVKDVDGVERVFGIASLGFARNCSRTNQIVLYTRVSHYEEFITYTLGRSSELGSASLCPRQPSPSLSYQTRSDGMWDVKVAWTADGKAEGYRVFYAPFPGAAEAVNRLEMGAGQTELTVALASGMKFLVSVQGRSSRCDSALSSLLTVNVP